MVSYHSASFPCFVRPFARVLVLVLVLCIAGLSAQTAHAQPPKGWEVSAVPSATAVSPGGQIVVALIIQHETGYHTWPAQTQNALPAGFDFAILTELKLVDSGGGAVAGGRVQWAELHEAPVPDSSGMGVVHVPVFSDRAVTFVPITVANDVKPGEVTIAFEYSAQACDDSGCLMPATERVEVILTVAPDGVLLYDPSTAPSELTSDFALFDASVFSDPANVQGELSVQGIANAVGDASAAALKATQKQRFFGMIVPSGNTLTGVLFLSMLAALGGMILNLTPCVLPVIPIKVMAISKHAGSHSKSIVLGMWMALGVVAFWIGIGLPVAFLTSVTDPSRIFGIWWVTLGLGLIIAVMGVGSMGAFAPKLPNWVYSINPKADSAWGSFLFGVMTAVLGLPCFGFVAGALLAGVATMPATAILAIFGSLGAGMALPYLVLAFKPSLVKKLPRTGPASELVKQVMGLFMLAAAAWFIGAGMVAFISERPGLYVKMPWWWKQVHVWLVAIFVLAGCALLLVRTLQITPQLGRRVVFGVVAVLFGSLAGAYAIDSTIKAKNNFWIPFSQEALTEALAADKVVVVDFTAEWCVNCKALKAGVLNRDPVKSRLRDASVVALVADLTSNSAPGWKILNDDLGQVGIPTLAVYAPNVPAGELPWIANNYTSSVVIDALKNARAKASSALTSDAR